jgi:hypothetical protein
VKGLHKIQEALDLLRWLMKPTNRKHMFAADSGLAAEHYSLGLQIIHDTLAWVSEDQQFDADSGMKVVDLFQANLDKLAQLQSKIEEYKRLDRIIQHHSMRCRCGDCQRYRALIKQM